MGSAPSKPAQPQPPPQSEPPPEPLPEPQLRRQLATGNQFKAQGGGLAGRLVLGARQHFVVLPIDGQEHQKKHSEHGTDIGMIVAVQVDILHVSSQQRVVCELDEPLHYQVDAYYTPQSVGEYRITVKLNGDELCASPFVVDVQPAFQRLDYCRIEESLVKSINVQFYPWDIAVARDGRFVICGNKTPSIGVVQLHAADGSLIRVITASDSSGNQLIEPRFLAINNQDQILVTDHSTDRVHVFDMAGCLLYKFHTQSPGSGYCGLSINDRNQVMLADYKSNCIKIFTMEGELIKQFDSSDSAVGKLERPMSVTVNSHGHMLCTSYVGDAVRVLDGDGKFMFEFGIDDVVPRRFGRSLKYVIVDPFDRIVVLDCHYNRIQVFDVDGSLVSHFTPGLAPRGLAIDQTGRIFVSVGTDKVLIISVPLMAS